MIKKLKHIVSLALVLILLAPLTTQLFDALFHHHHQFGFHVNTENHFQVYKDKCSIPDFQLSFFSFAKEIAEAEKTDYSEPLILLDRSDYFSDISDYSFLLRAPPAPTRLS